MRIDLNCDATGSTADTLLTGITAANVPCDWTPRRMREACEAAVKRGVAIGALVGYRHGPYVDDAELIDDVLYQLGALDALAGTAGGEVRYVKPLMRDEHAVAVAEAFPGRQYHPAGQPLEDVLTDPGEVAWRCLHLVTRGEITAVDGTVIPLRADSLFVPAEISPAVRDVLHQAGVELRSFA